MMIEKTCVIPPQDLRCYADSGTTSHVFHNTDAFAPGSLTRYDPRKVSLADKSMVTATHSGEVIIPLEHVNMRRRNILLVPKLGYNLISVGQLADNGIELRFASKKLKVFLAEKNLLLVSGFRDSTSGLYTLPHPKLNPRALAIGNCSEAKVWHRRLAHINNRDISTVHLNAEGVPEIKPSEDIFNACRLGKAQKLYFQGKFRNTCEVGEKVHSDIMGPLEPSFPHNYKYTVTFLGDYT